MCQDNRTADVGLRCRLEQTLETCSASAGKQNTLPACLIDTFRPSPWLLVAPKKGLLQDYVQWIHKTSEGLMIITSSSAQSRALQQNSRLRIQHSEALARHNEGPARVSAIGDPGQFPTYTDLLPAYQSPANAAVFRVEMGNVGQHYHKQPSQ
jgi:hypothetical protein